MKQLLASYNQSHLTPLAAPMFRLSRAARTVRALWHDAGMNEEPAASRALTRTEASAAVTGLGWRYVLGVARTFVRTESLRRAAEAAAVIAAAGGQAADGRLLIDIRPDCMILTVPFGGQHDRGRYRARGADLR